MPPKKAKSLEKQAKLFSKETVEEKKPAKSKSKQFTGDKDQKVDVQPSTHKWKYGNGKTPEKLFISSWNVNGIRAVVGKEELQKYMAKANPDIICFN